MKPIAILLASFAVTVGCEGGAAPGTHAGRVRGIVVSGPTTPVFRPDDPACADRPVAGAQLRLESLDGRPTEIFTSDSAGHFDRSVPAGRYRLVPQPVKGTHGTPTSVEFTVLEDADVDLKFSYDTGIR
jgi:hypothetical protein